MQFDELLKIVKMTNCVFTNDVLVDLFIVPYMSTVICPYRLHNCSMDISITSNNTSDALFHFWWSKTNTIPFYLIVLLLPLLNFRSASFFARFTFLGKLL